MGVSLYYATSDDVDPETKRIVLAEAESLQSGRDWWCEPLLFVTNDPDGQKSNKLEGDSKLFFSSGYTAGTGEWIEIDCDEDEFMARRDAHFIVNRLCDWSSRFNLKWALDLAGVEIGEIRSGKLTADAIKNFKLNGLDITIPVDENEARRISQKYASRNGSDSSSL